MIITRGVASIGLSGPPPLSSKVGWAIYLLIFAHTNAWPDKLICLTNFITFLQLK